MQSLVHTYNQNVSLGKIQREKEQERLINKFDNLRILVEKSKRKILFSKSVLTPKGIRLGRRGLREIHDHGYVCGLS